MTVKSYDIKCHDLARHFIDDVIEDNLSAEHSHQSHLLAIHIQQAIEDWLESYEHAHPRD